METIKKIFIDNLMIDVNQGQIYRRGRLGQTRITAPPLYYFKKYWQGASLKK